MVVCSNSLENTKDELLLQFNFLFNMEIIVSFKPSIVPSYYRTLPADLFGVIGHFTSKMAPGEVGV